MSISPTSPIKAIRARKKKVQNDLLEQKYIDLTTTYDRMKLKPNLEKDGKLSLLCNLYKKRQVSHDLDIQKKDMLSKIRFSTSIAFLMSIMMFFTLDNLQLLNKVMIVNQSAYKCANYSFVNC
jgi:hypothetical protein